MTAIITVSLFFALMALGVPIAISLGLVAAAGLVLLDGYPIAVVSQKLFEISEHESLLAIPLFVLAGYLMDQGGLSERLVRAVSAIIGFVRGGLGIVAVATCMLFSGISGSAIADSAAVGSVMIKPMKDRGYSPIFSSCLIASSGTIASIIPPSIAFIIYGVVAETSITQLFLAGVIPGLLMGFFLMLVAYVAARLFDYPKEQKLPIAHIIREVLGAVPAFLLIAIIIGGILGGIFTITEAAVVSVGYALIVGMFVYRNLTVESFVLSVRHTVDTTAMIIWLISTASLLSWILTIERVPDIVAAYMLSVTSDPMFLLAIIAILYLIVGTVIDTAPGILLLVPILLPVVANVGIDPVHFGVVTIVGLSVGLVTPPTAPPLSVCAAIAGIRFDQTFLAIIPFMLAMTIVLFLVVFFPALSLWLPRSAM